ncbi:Dual specificity protein phosphatase 12 [Linum grandiflorum]
MPHLVRENLFIGNITDAAEVLDGTSSSDITHLLSVLSSASISFFSEWRPTLSIPTKEISKVYFNRQRDGPAPDDDDHSAAKLMYSLEYAGNDFKLVRMAVPIRDTESEDLLDYLEVCLDFIDRSRKEGSVLVHCFAGVSRSAAIITAYLMRSEQLSLEGQGTFLSFSLGLFHYQSSKLVYIYFLQNNFGMLLNHLGKAASLFAQMMAF